MKKLFLFAFIAVAIVLVSACQSHPSLPQTYQQAEALPKIFPDYTDVTVPVNIGPLNFMIDDADEVVAQLTSGSLTYNYGKGNKVMIPFDEWDQLKQAAKDGKIAVDVYARHEDKWTRYRTFHINVVPDSIDSYISYRVLPPTYVGFEDLVIRQYNLTNFEESDIYNTRQINTEAQGQCINCHSYQNYRTNNMMFHLRLVHDGTMIVSDGKLKKVRIKTPEMISEAVYNAWHPFEKIIAFSTDRTMQSFHTRDITKVEVMESASDIVIYDVNTDKVQTVLAEPDELELFPTWSPDGKWMYYCSAHYEYNHDSDGMNETLNHYSEIKYNLYRIAFDIKTRTFGEPELIYDAVSKGRSAVEPRVSADGRYVVFAEGPNGLFHIWHPSAQIEILDMQTRQLLPTKAMNSARAESYPSFSSTGRWILLESRRDDGNFTRTYIAYFDAKGKVHKAFEVPHADPEYNHLLLRSWSRPEFMVEPVTITPRMFYDKAMEEATAAK